jgi:glycerophosphoryl diester phosphodiesterase
MPVKKRRLLIFAHRGASAHAPENTIAAFELAIKQGADLVELDAKLSADQRVVVIHDQTVDRTTDGTGRVSTLDYDSLRILNAGYRFRESFPGECIPRLEEVIEICVGRIKINIELTNYLSPFDQLAGEVSRIINHYHLGEQVLVSSFHPIPLRKFHDLSPEIPIALLARKGYQGWLSRGWLGRVLISYDALHPEKSDITEALIATARKLEYPVHTYTVNDAGDMARLISLGVDGLITDDPLLASSVAKDHKFIDI